MTNHVGDCPKCTHSQLAERHTRPQCGRAPEVDFFTSYLADKCLHPAIEPAPSRRSSLKVIRDIMCRKGEKLCGRHQWRLWNEQR